MSFTQTSNEIRRETYIVNETAIIEQCAKERRNIEQYDMQIKTLECICEKLEKELLAIKEELRAELLGPYTSLNEQIQTFRMDVIGLRVARDDLLNNVETLERERYLCFFEGK